MTAVEKLLEQFLDCYEDREDIDAQQIDDLKAAFLCGMIKGMQRVEGISEEEILLNLCELVPGMERTMLEDKERDSLY